MMEREEDQEALDKLEIEGRQGHEDNKETEVWQAQQDRKDNQVLLVL